MMKKILSIMLMVCILITVGTVYAGESDHLPEGIPAGAVKIAEGIYAIETALIPNSGVVSRTRVETVIPSVPAYGTYIEPSDCTVLLETGQNFIKATIDGGDIRVNFVGGGHSAFGSNMLNWINMGGGVTYYIEAAYYNIANNVTYQMQCTSSTGSAQRNVGVTLSSNRYGQN